MKPYDYPSDNTIICIVFSILFVWGLHYYCSEQADSASRKSNTTINSCIEDTTFDVRDFVLELHIQEVKYPDIVLRQAALESGWFTSSAWRTKHNPFGFTYKGEYLMFNDWHDAIGYMKSWQDKYYKGGDYYLFLERIGYALDSNYVCTLKNIDLNNLKNK